MAERMEMAEISAAKNAVWSILDDFELEGELITVADRIVEDLLKRGVLVPEWFPDPHDGEKPAQGYYPTSSQVEAWQGRPVTPIRITGR